MELGKKGRQEHLIDPLGISYHQIMRAGSRRLSKSIGTEKTEGILPSGHDGHCRWRDKQSNDELQVGL